MADYYEATAGGIVVTTQAQVIAEIETFLTISIAAPDLWTADGTYTGDAYLEATNASAPAAPCYVALNAVAGSGVRAYWTDGTDYGAGVAIPADNVPGGLLMCADPPVGSITYGGRLWLFADANRFIACLKWPFFTGGANYHTVYSMLYAGYYTAHNNTDAYPLVTVSNVMSTAIDSLLLDTSFTAEQKISMTSFPAIWSHHDINDIPEQSTNIVVAGAMPGPLQMIPVDNSVAPPEIFLYEQWLVDYAAGKGKSMFLTGTYRVSNTLVPESFYVVGAATYFCWPGCMLPAFQNRGPMFLIGPRGTGV